MKNVFLLSISIFLTGFVYAQSKTVDSLLPPKNQFQCFYDINLIEGSLRLSDIHGHKQTELLILDAESPRRFCVKPHHEQLRLSYRTFSPSLTSVYTHKDPSIIHSIGDENGDSLWLRPANFTIPQQKTNTVTIDGSISRSISVGNQQDMVMNSDMNLEIEGKLTDKLFVLASISDNEVPIQPEGNSQSLQEFDKVFIKLYDDNDNHLIMGDYEIKNRESAFLKYNKKLQGATAQGKLSFKESANLKSSSSFAVSKGRYCNQQLFPVEGNNGPYRLTGCENELYITIIAGSEKVFLNGELLQRGFENHYTINYNTAEITFTHKLLIASENRIRVEFEYTDQNYTRFFVANTTQIQVNKNIFRLNLYSEGDNKNQPLNAELNDIQKQMLAEGGDMPVYTSSIQYDSAFAAEAIYYHKTDSTVNSVLYRNVLVIANDKTDSLFRASFSYTGPGMGNYLIDSSSANGRIFKWIAPDALGNKQGDYSPLQVVPAAKLKQIAEFSSSIALTLNTDFTFAFAVSNNDINTFSDLDANDDLAYAFKTGILQRIHLDSAHRFELSGAWRLVQKNFSAVENYNSSEFNRDWNIIDSHADENLLSFCLSYFSPAGKIATATELMNRNSQMHGKRFSARADNQLKHLRHILNASYLSSEMSLFNTDFIRFSNTIEYLLFKQTTGYRFDTEQNVWKDTANILGDASESFIENKFYLKSSDTVNVQYSASFTARTNRLPDEAGFAFNDFSNSRTVSLSGAKQKGSHMFTLSVNYRQKKFEDGDLGNEREENLNARFSEKWQPKKGGLSIAYFYELGSGLERILSYQYVRVDDGQGTYMWNSETDYNGNGIAELDEFEVPLFQSQANFIRFSLPTNEYDKLIASRLNFSSDIDLYRLLPKKKGMADFPRLFSNSLSADFQQKTKSLTLTESLLPFEKAVPEHSIFSQRELLRNLFFFNKRSRKFSFSILSLLNTSKNQTVNGAEKREKRENRLLCKFAFASQLFCRAELARIFELNQSEAGFMSGRDYDLSIWELAPGLEWQPGQVWRLSNGFILKQKQNTDGGQHSFERRYWFESKVSFAAKMQISFRFDFSKISFNSEATSAIGYTMLEGLQTGNNYIWRLTASRQLMELLHLQFTYDGLSSPNRQPFHVGQIVLRALL